MVKIAKFCARTRADLEEEDRQKSGKTYCFCERQGESCGESCRRLVLY